MPYTYRYPRPALTVDCVVFGLDDGELKIVLIRRARDPFAGCWAFPGGFVEVGESPEAAARRELEEETGLRLARVEQLYPGLFVIAGIFWPPRVSKQLDGLRLDTRTEVQNGFADCV